jgi:hypothetical protein
MSKEILSSAMRDIHGTDLLDIINHSRQESKQTRKCFRDVLSKNIDQFRNVKICTLSRKDLYRCFNIYEWANNIDNFLELNKSDDYNE